MNTDRRIYLTTAVVAVAVAMAISVFARTASFAPAINVRIQQSGTANGIVVREAQSGGARDEAIGVRAPITGLDFERRPTPPHVVLLASAL